MDVKKYMQGVYYAEQSIRAKRERIQKLRALATNAVGSVEAVRVGGSGERSRVECCVAEIDALEREIVADIRSLTRHRRAVERIIHTVPEPRHQLVLELRHLCGLTWPEIARRMHYSEYHARTGLYAAAIASAQKVADKKTNPA